MPAGSCAGGMSVGPDDVTRQVIAHAGAKEFLHGPPVLPGAMFLVCLSAMSRFLVFPPRAIYHEAMLYPAVRCLLDTNWVLMSFPKRAIRVPAFGEVQT